MSPRITAYLRDHCPVCASDMSQPKSLINHLKTQHQMVLPARKAGQNRPRDPAYEFSKDQADCQVERLACPSCWKHFSEPHELEHHFQVHLNNQDDSNMSEASQYPDEYEEYDEEAAISSNGSKGSKEDEKDAQYLEKSNELFSTLDELIAGFKKLLPYDYTNEKKSNK
ncbi:putative NRPS-like protein biosynthetic cluster [Mucor velutinosus]|uniref:NRPS-like protein biosynthetic cluster n=1 Tax=Mucor velutinosus TaxID=708070 RepID=A0AAN7DNP3_9FUNG|nr:putative NRPS-like protein biosynthetic cluster [Mucor velutinosus]